MSDLISRQAAIDAVGREQSLIERPITETRWFDLGLRKAQDVLSDLPSAQRKGKWIYPTDIKGFGRCPHCKALWDYSLISNPFFKFCPRCGNGENEFAELKGEEDETD